MPLVAVPKVSCVAPDPAVARFHCVTKLSVTIKSSVLLAVTQAVVTETFPLVAAAGTVTVMLVALLAVTTAAVELKVTVLLAGVVLNPVPVMVIVLPGMPTDGDTDVTVSGVATTCVSFTINASSAPALVRFAVHAPGSKSAVP